LQGYSLDRELRPRRDQPLQTNIHLPRGGIPTNTEALPTFAKRLTFFSYFKGQDQ
jgi:hypothetical protein